MIAAIDAAKEDGDTLGGIVEVSLKEFLLGLEAMCNGIASWMDVLLKRLFRFKHSKVLSLALALKQLSKEAPKYMMKLCILRSEGFYRASNRAGGFEGGMTTGEPIVVRGVMKPISTLYKALQSVDIDTKEPFTAQVERSDTCAVPAAGVIMENIIAWEVAHAFLEKFGGDSIEEIHANLANYKAQVESY